MAFVAVSVASIVVVVGLGSGTAVSAPPWRGSSPDAQTPRARTPAARTGSCVAGWAVAPKPYTRGFLFDRLEAASAVSSHDVWAVGTRFSEQHANATQALIEHWDGHRWTAIPGADLGAESASLSGVAALAPNDVWVAGWDVRRGSQNRDLLIEHWNGRRWSASRGAPLTTQAGGAGLFDIAAVAPHDVWIRGADSPVVNGESVSRDFYEHWDGRRWAVFVGPQSLVPAAGTAATQVIAADRTGDVWAGGGKVSGFSEAGQLAGSLVERWNGASWVEVSSPAGVSAIGSLAVVGARDVWAVVGTSLTLGGGVAYGPTGSAQFVHWDGTNWNRSVPADGVQAIRARGPGDSWAVGSVAPNTPQIQHWDGQRWQTLNTAPPRSVTSGFVRTRESGGVWDISIAPDRTVVVFASDYPTGSASSGGYQGPPPGRAHNYLWVDCPSPGRRR